jgi:hypothetical protein
MKTIFALLFSLITFTAAQAQPFEGVVCTSERAIEGAHPKIFIKNISGGKATLSLSMDGIHTDTRPAKMDILQTNGTFYFGFVSSDTMTSRPRTNFAVYISGPSPQEATTGFLYFEENELELELSCQDGMTYQG